MASTQLMKNGGSAPDLHELLDALPADRMVACLPTRERLVLHDGETKRGSIPLAGVVDVSLHDDSSVRRRPTIGRFLLLRPLAFLFPKTALREAYRLCIHRAGSMITG